MGEHDTLWAGLGDGVEVETTSLVARGLGRCRTRTRAIPTRTRSTAARSTSSQFAERERDADGRPRGTRRRGALLRRGRPAPDVRAAPRRPLSRRSRIGASSSSTTTACGTSRRSAARARRNCRRSTSTTRCCAGFQLDPGMDIDARSRAVSRGAGRAMIGPMRCSRPGAAPKRPSSRSRTSARSTPRSASPGTGCGRGRSSRTSRPFRRPERAYYEDFMCTTPHNPNNVDLEPRRAVPPHHARSRARCDVGAHRRERLAARSTRASTCSSRLRGGRRGTARTGERHRGPAGAPEGAALLDR